MLSTYLKSNRFVLSKMAASSRLTTPLIVAPTLRLNHHDHASRVATASTHLAASQLSLHERLQNILLSKDDGDKPPPKGFEKFFKKKQERKETKNSEEKESGEKKNKGKFLPT